jgi:hypothetical protein
MNSKHDESFSARAVAAATAATVDAIFNASYIIILMDGVSKIVSFRSSTRRRRHRVVQLQQQKKKHVYIVRTLPLLSHC